MVEWMHKTTTSSQAKVKVTVKFKVKLCGHSNNILHEFQIDNLSWCQVQFAIQPFAFWLVNKGNYIVNVKAISMVTYSKISGMAREKVWLTRGATSCGVKDFIHTFVM